MRKTYGFLFLIISILSAPLVKANNLKPLEGKTILLVYGGWKGHNPEAFKDKISPWLKEQGAKLILSDSLQIYAHEGIMSEVDLIIQSWTMDKISSEQAKGLLKAVKNGAGIAGFHGGTGDSFRDNVEYQYMVGGQWVAHPGGQLDYMVNITDTNDEITKGLHDFKVHSEQYYMHVDPNVKVLATTTFSGEHNSWINGAVIPVVWKKNFGKGRVFYNSIGHNMSDYDIPESWDLLTRGIIWAVNSKYAEMENLVSPVYPTSLKMGDWVNLIDKDLSQWDIFMGAPHTSTEIEGYEKFDDVTKGTPIGLNKDPKNVFSVIEQEGEEVIKITGEIFAGLVTKNEYENYHLKWQFKWGDKRWEPRLKLKRNSGVLYHSVGDYTDFWNVWMTTLECEVQETDCGDFIPLGAVKAQCPAMMKEGKYYFTPGAELVDFCWNYGCEKGRCFKPGNPEKEHGEWNTMELYCLGDTSIHVLNGHIVMVVVDPLVKLNDTWEPMNKGKIQIQSEAAEVFYKNIKIRTIHSLSKNIRQSSGLE